MHASQSSSFQVLSECKFLDCLRHFLLFTFYDFVGPTQVWARSLSTPEYVRLSSIKKRVAFCETDIDFGRVDFGRVIVIA